MMSSPLIPLVCYVSHHENIKKSYRFICKRMVFLLWDDAKAIVQVINAIEGFFSFFFLRQSANIDQYAPTFMFEVCRRQRCK